MSALYQRGPARIIGNLTPMIDMTFLLIVFFVLVSRIVSNESEPMNLPALNDPDTQALVEENRVVINVIPDATSGIKGYRIGGANFSPNDQGLQAMLEQLTALYRSNPQINVNLRADRRTHYEYVEPVLQVIADAARAAGEAGGAAGVAAGPAGARVNLVVSTEED